MFSYTQLHLDDHENEKTKEIKNIYKNNKKKKRKTKI